MAKDKEDSFYLDMLKEARDRRFEVPNYPQTVNINHTEHRAPTDDSIKIYEGMVERAKQSFLDKVDVKDTIINGTVLYFQDQPWNNEIHAHIKFFINGEEQRVSVKLNPDDLPFHAQRELVRKHVIQAIGIEVVNQLFEKIKIKVDETGGRLV